MKIAFAVTAVLLGVSVLSSPVAAGPDRGELEQVRREIQTLMDKAAALEEAGHHEEAGQVMRHAEELGAKLREMSRGEGEEPRAITREEAKKLLGDLERGAAALKRLGRMEDAERVWKVRQELAAHLKQAESRTDGPREGKRTTKQVIEHRLEVLRLAKHGLLEAEKKELAERIERAIHAHELLLEGYGPDHAEVRKAPPAGEMAEILNYAARIWRGFEQPGKAEYIETLAREYAAQRNAKGHAGSREREIAKRHLEILRSAMPALREGERHDAAELLEHAIHARELLLEGRGDDEARRIIKSAPGPGDLAEILTLASDLWTKFGHESKASQCKELAEHYRQIWVKSRKQRPEHDTVRRLDELEKQLAEMRRAMEHIQIEIEAIRREMR